MVPVAVEWSEPEASGTQGLAAPSCRRRSRTRNWPRVRSGGAFRLSTSCGSCARRRHSRGRARSVSCCAVRGLYSSLLTEWRRARDAGALEALARPRGPKPNPLEAENARLRRRAERAEAELSKARRVIEVQGNVSALLGELLEPKGAQTNTER